jgi:hypothetical protein
MGPTGKMVEAQAFSILSDNISAADRTRELHLRVLVDNGTRFLYCRHIFAGAVN